MAEASKDLQLVDGDQLECAHVESESGDGAQVLAREHDIRMVDGDRDKRVDKHPAMKMPVLDMGHFILLGVDGHLLVESDGMDAQQFVEPVENRPLVAVGATPGGFHRILRIAHDDNNFSVCTFGEVSQVNFCLEKPGVPRP